MRVLPVQCECGGGGVVVGSTVLEEKHYQKVVLTHLCALMGRPFIEDRTASFYFSCLQTRFLVSFSLI